MSAQHDNLQNDILSQKSKLETINSALHTCADIKKNKNMICNIKLMVDILTPNRNERLKLHIDLASKYQITNESLWSVVLKYSTKAVEEKKISYRLSNLTKSIGKQSFHYLASVPLIHDQQNELIVAASISFSQPINTILGHQFIFEGEPFNGEISIPLQEFKFSREAIEKEIRLACEKSNVSLPEITHL